MRVVLDTNIYISAILFGGVSEKVLEALSQREALIFISPFIVREIRDVLKKKFGWDRARIALMLDDLQELTLLIRPAVKINAILERKDDNQILACALAAKADVLISGDRKHILPLKMFQGIKIVSPREFLSYFYF
jgi:putative PIN family toxin of toxin-antitoxin system